MDGLTTSGFVPRVALFTRTGTVEGIVSSASAVASRSTLIFRCREIVASAIARFAGTVASSSCHQRASSCEGRPVYATSIGWESASMSCRLILKDSLVFSSHVHSKVRRPACVYELASVETPVLRTSPEISSEYPNPKRQRGIGVL